MAGHGHGHVYVYVYGHVYVYDCDCVCEFGEFCRGGCTWTSVGHHGHPHAYPHCYCKLASA